MVTISAKTQFQKKIFSKLKSLGVLKHILMSVNKTRSYNKYLF